MYSKLNDTQKEWILTKTGKQLYSEVLKLIEQKKIDNETTKQMFAFWLNQHKIRGKWEKYEYSELEEEANKIFN